MTTQHTPGPWTRKRPIPEDATISRLVFAGDDLIAAVHDLEDAGHEAAANARLIAAAPALLEALLELVAEWDARHADEDHRTGYTLDTYGVQLARAAIDDFTKEA